MEKFYVDFVAHMSYVIEAEDEDNAAEIAEHLLKSKRNYPMWEVEDVSEAPEDAEPDNVGEM